MTTARAVIKRGRPGASPRGRTAPPGPRPTTASRAEIAAAAAAEATPLPPPSLPLCLSAVRTGFFWIFFSLPPSYPPNPPRLPDNLAGPRRERRESWARGGGEPLRRAFCSAAHRKAEEQGRGEKGRGGGSPGWILRPKLATGRRRVRVPPGPPPRCRTGGRTGSRTAGIRRTQDALPPPPCCEPLLCYPLASSWGLALGLKGGG